MRITAEERWGIWTEDRLNVLTACGARLFEPGVFLSAAELRSFLEDFLRNVYKDRYAKTERGESGSRQKWVFARTAYQPEDSGRLP